MDDCRSLDLVSCSDRNSGSRSAMGWGSSGSAGSHGFSWCGSLWLGSSINGASHPGTYPLCVDFFATQEPGSSGVMEVTCIWNDHPLLKWRASRFCFHAANESESSRTIVSFKYPEGTASSRVTRLLCFESVSLGNCCRFYPGNHDLCCASVQRESTRFGTCLTAWSKEFSVVMAHLLY